MWTVGGAIAGGDGLWRDHEEGCGGQSVAKISYKDWAANDQRETNGFRKLIKIKQIHYWACL